MDYTPLKRSSSETDLSLTPAADYYYEVMDRYQPWYSKYYRKGMPFDDDWYWRYHYASEFYPYQYYRTRRFADLGEPTFTYYSFPRHRSIFGMDPSIYRSYYYSYPYRSYSFPYRYWTTPSYYESKLYDSTPYRPYGWYYPRPYSYYY